MTKDIPELQSILARLDSVEKQNRKMKRIWSAVILGIGALAVMGQILPTKFPAIVEAERFVMRDKAGISRALLEVGPDGSAAIHFYHSDGKRRAAFGVLPDGLPDLHLYDRNGNTRAMLRIMPNGAAGLAVAGEDGSTRAGVTGLVDGTAMFSLYNKDGNPRAILGSPPIGAPALNLWGADQKNQAQLLIMPDGLPSFHLLSKDAAIGIDLLSDGSPSLILVRNGKPIWRAP